MAAVRNVEYILGLGVDRTLGICGLWMTRLVKIKEKDGLPLGFIDHERDFGDHG